MSPTKISPLPISQWLPSNACPLLIAGPCSAESREQFLTTAQQLAETGKVTALRGGVWKPRTRPGSFEGIGTPALSWLIEARELTGLPVATEVANAFQVEAALKAGIDIFWIGARTTVNPFYVQEIADALIGVDIPVLVKNPIHPDLGLWIGAIERLQAAGISKLAAIHRGFFAYESAPFRNEPRWEMTFELRTLAPDLPILCDPSHIAGNREMLQQVSQTALDLNLDGLMIESHYNPDQALSDAQQQIIPGVLNQLIEDLTIRNPHSEEAEHQLRLLRQQIDENDFRIIELLQKRFDIVKQVGTFKEKENIPVFQLDRFFSMLETRRAKGQQLDFDASFMNEIFQVIHKYSVKSQIESAGLLKK